VDEGLLGEKGCSTFGRWIDGGDWLLKSRRQKNNNSGFVVFFNVILNSSFGP